MAGISENEGLCRVMRDAVQGYQVRVSWALYRIQHTLGVLGLAHVPGGLMRGTSTRGSSFLHYRPTLN